MTKLAQLQIDLNNINKRIGSLLANCSNTDKALLFNTACEAHAVTSQLCIEIDKLIVPSFTELPITGEATKAMTDLTDKRWESGL